MIRKLPWGVLLLSLTAHAQTPPNRTVPSPLPASAATAAPVAPAAPSTATAPTAFGSSNPFAPKTTTNTPAPVVQDLTPPPPPPKTEESVRADVESAFRARGTRVGRVNGQTFFKLESSYLFVPTGLEDAQPVVAGEGHSSLKSANTPAPMTPGSGPRALTPPPAIPAPPAGTNK